MATADQVKALVRSHAEGDNAQFYAVAMQVAARAARSGQTRFAKELRDLVDAAKAASEKTQGRQVRPVPVVQPRGDLAGLLGALYPNQHLGDLVVDFKVRESLEQADAYISEAFRVWAQRSQGLWTLDLEGLRPYVLGNEYTRIVHLAAIPPQQRQSAAARSDEV